MKRGMPLLMWRCATQVRSAIRLSIGQDLQVDHDVHVQRARVCGRHAWPRCDGCGVVGGGFYV
jgi:hypothetical protein